MKNLSKVNGGKAAGAAIKAKNLAAYLTNPNKCVCCNSEILPTTNQSLFETKQKKFCNNSCAATYNNSLRLKKEQLIEEKQVIGEYCLLKISTCKNCGVLFVIKPKGKTGIIYAIKNCYDCRVGPVKIKTKQEIFKRNKNWQSARSSIRKDAYKAFIKAGKPLVCPVCDYDKHCDVCHKKPVSDFPNEALISEINDIENLMPLCPNHHWEFDEGLLSLEEIEQCVKQKSQSLPTAIPIVSSIPINNSAIS